MKWLRRTWATISLDDLYHNYQQIRKQVNCTAKFLGVVKADAYGHGAVAVSRALAEFGADYLAVSNLEEAIQLRKAGIELPVLILGYTPAEYATELVQWRITQTVHSLNYAQQLSHALAGTQLNIRVHFKIDTGMARIGFMSYDKEQSLQDAVRSSVLPRLLVEGAFTHFSSSDSTSPDAISFTELQYQRFNYALDYLKSFGLTFSICHCCNSGAIIQHPKFAMDMVRSGIITYGLSPSLDLDGSLDLRPIMSLETVVAQIKELPSENPVGYSRTFKSNCTRRIATLPIGYADGFPIALSGQVHVYIRNHACSVVGRICMDMCMVDVTDIPDVQVGDVATVIGVNNSCADLAAILNTIPYEVVCRISKRVPRVYIKDEKEIDILRYIG